MGDMNIIKGLDLLKTMQSAKKRSIPKVQVSTYLDLYVFNREKERLLKEDERLCMRKDAIKKRMEEINLQINKLIEAEFAIKDSGNTSFPPVKKEWKRISLGY